MSYSQALKGYYIYPKTASGVNVRSTPVFNGLVLRTVTYSALVGMATGNYVASDGYWVEVNNLGRNGYVRSDVVAFKDASGKSYTMTFPGLQQEKESLSNIEKYMQCEQRVFSDLAKCKAFIAICDNKKITSSAYLSNKKQFETLAARYNARQSSIDKQQQLKVERAQGLAKAVDNVVNNIVNMPKTPTYFSGPNHLGIAPVLIPLFVPVIKFALVGIAAVSLWLLLRKNSEDSQSDLKISHNLEKALSSLAPAEREVVEKNLQKQIDKAYQKGSNSTTLGMVLTGVKFLIIGTIGFILAKKIF